MEAIARACQKGELDAQVAVVVSPEAQTPAAKTAQSLGLKVAVTPNPIEALQGCDLICLAGYMRLLPGEVLDAFPKRVLNIHPSLLPAYGGKGMYGKRVHEAVLAAKETRSGCTVHRVGPVYDEGEIILQMQCPVLPEDTPGTLAARVLQLEHQLYPKAIAKVLREQ